MVRHRAYILRSSRPKRNKDKAQSPPLPESSQNLNHHFQPPCPFYPTLLLSTTKLPPRNEAKFLLGRKATYTHAYTHVRTDRKFDTYYAADDKQKNLSGHTVDDNFNCATPPLSPLSGPRLHSSPLLGLIVLVVVCRGNPVRGQDTREWERGRRERIRTERLKRHDEDKIGERQIFRHRNFEWEKRSRHPVATGSRGQGTYYILKRQKRRTG